MILCDPLGNQGSKPACAWSFLNLDVAPGVDGPGAPEFLAEVVCSAGRALLEGGVASPIEDQSEDEHEQDEPEE